MDNDITLLFMALASISGLVMGLIALILQFRAEGKINVEDARKLVSEGRKIAITTKTKLDDITLDAADSLLDAYEDSIEVSEDNTTSFAG